MSQLLVLCFEFFKTGLFAIGGGLATIPFLYHMAEQYAWLDQTMLANMIAVSESTPGPLGVNMATYVGFQAFGIVGAIAATFSLVAPSVIIIILISKVLEKFKSNIMVQSGFYGLRPAVTALIAIAGLEVAKIALLTAPLVPHFWEALNYKSLILLASLMLFQYKIKLHPVIIILIAAVIGVIFQF